MYIYKQYFIILWRTGRVAGTNAATAGAAEEATRTAVAAAATAAATADGSTTDIHAGEPVPKSCTIMCISSLLFFWFKNVCSWLCNGTKNVTGHACPV